MRGKKQVVSILALIYFGSPRLGHNKNALHEISDLIQRYVQF